MKFKKNCLICLAGILAAIFFIAASGTNPVFAGTNGKTQADAVNWACARGNENWCVDVDGAYGCQCVDLILAYYKYLAGYTASGNAKDYTWNALPGGWTRVYSNPQPGDVVVWNAGARLGAPPLKTEYANSSYGHIGIIWQVNASGSISTIETNTYNSVAAGYRERSTSNVACYIRPDFAGGTTIPAGYLNLGNSFQAALFRTDVWRRVTANGDNVELLATADRVDAREHWRFERQSDGSYIISNFYDGRVLDVTGAGNTGGTNIIVYQKWGDDNSGQRWFIYGNKNAYRLVPKCAPHLSLDCAGDGMAGGTNLQLASWNGLGAQVFSISQFYGTVPQSVWSRDLTLSVGESAALEAGINPSNAIASTLMLSYAIADTSVATVDANGRVTAVAAGETTVTVRSVFNDKLLNVSKIRVEDPNDSAPQILRAELLEQREDRLLIYLEAEDDHKIARITGRGGECYNPETGDYVTGRNVTMSQYPNSPRFADVLEVDLFPEFMGGDEHVFVVCVADDSGQSTMQEVRFQCPSGFQLQMNPGDTIDEEALFAQMDPNIDKNDIPDYERYCNETSDVVSYANGVYTMNKTGRYSVMFINNKSGNMKSVTFYSVDASEIPDTPENPGEPADPDTCQHENTVLTGKKEATCTIDGYTGDLSCSDCGMVLETGAQTAKKGHNKVKDAAVPATYISGGLTQGEHCIACGKITKAQTALSPRKLGTPWIYTMDKKRKARIEISGVTDATGYEIYRSNKKYRGFKQIKTTGKTVFTNKNLRRNKKYYYKVRAYKIIGGTKVYSDFSNTSKVKIRR